MVVGVYPSALHVRWSAPGGPRVTALAVAAEPWPFWAGEGAAQRVERWKDQVGWRPGWGTAADAGHVNGSSGRRVRDEVLAPLGVSIDDVWTTDVLPWFFVHRGPGTQGEAMAGRYDPWATQAGQPLHALPPRPSPDVLVARAVAEERDRLRAEIVSSSCRLVVALGNETLRVLAACADEHDLPGRLVPDHSYGTLATMTVGATTVAVLPLVHPGQRGRVWRSAHSSWARAQVPAVLGQLR